MNKIFSGKVIVTSAYLVLAGLFLFAHFAQVESFAVNVGGIEVEGLTSKGSRLIPSAVRKIRLKMDLVEIDLRRGRNKAAIVTADNIRHSLEVLSWDSGENWVRIELNNGAGFLVRSDLNGKNVTIEPVIPDTQPPVTELEIPLRIVSKVKISSFPKRSEILTIENAQAAYTAILSPGSIWNTDSGRLDMAVSEESIPVFKLTSGDWNGIPASQWLVDAENDGTVLSLSDYNKALGEWREAVRRGWNSRYDTRQKLWVTAKGDPVWNDILAATFLSDSLGRGTFAASKEMVLSGMRQDPNSVGWIVSPFMGNIVYQGRVHSRDIERIADALDGNSGEASDLVYLLDTGRNEAIEKIIASALNTADVHLGFQDAVNRIMLLNEAKELKLADEKIITDVVTDLLEKIILPNIYWKDDGLWLMEETGVVDLPLSFQTGSLFQKQGEATGRDDFVRIGQQMIVSSAARVNEEGLMPLNAIFQVNAGVITEGLADPERLYRFVFDLPAWPRHVSLARQLGPGSWVLTGAESFAVQKTENGTVLIVTFPPGEIHHIALKGNMEYFNSIQMLGRTWKPDPAFQNYYTGWYADDASKLVFIKIQHRNRREVVRLIYEEQVIVEEPVLLESEQEETLPEDTDTDKEENTEQIPKE